MGVLATSYLASAVVCALLGLLAWRHRGATPAAGALAVCMAGLVWWSTVDLWAVLATEPTTTVARQLWMYPGVGATVAGFAALCWALVDPDWRPRGRVVLLLAVEPLLVSALALTNASHALVLRPSADGTPAYDFGPAFWAHAVYSYALLTWALVHVLRERRHAPAMRTRQLGLVLVGSVVPTVGNLVTLSGVLGVVDASGLCFVVTGLLNAVAVLRHGLLRVVPIARAQVLERLSHAVVVLDEQERVVDVNAAARTLLERSGLPAGDVLGRPARQVLGRLAGLCLGEGGEHEVELADGTPAWLDVRVTAIRDRRDRRLGHAVVVHDVTAATVQRRELARANAVLHEQVEVIERLRAEVAEQAVRDHLTGLHNRRHLSAVLEEHLDRFRACGEPVSIGVFDVDRFKAVNDAHGHGAGDRALQAVAERLRSAARPGETVARVGGEEFVLLLPGVGPAQALARVDEVRRQCAVSLPVRDEQVRITLSAGVASAAPGAASEAALSEAADRGLYRAKAAGRDRCAEGDLVPA